MPIPNRRPASALLLLLLATTAVGLRAQTRYDLIIRNGQVVDGTGSAPRRADVGVTGDRIRRRRPRRRYCHHGHPDAAGRTSPPGSSTSTPTPARAWARRG
jgi:adenine deaminase